MGWILTHSERCMPIRRKSAASATPQARGKGVIVCVDDEDVILHSLRRQLRAGFPGFTIKVARGGEQALPLLEQLHNDKREVPLLITDQLMPGMTGDELVAQVARLYPDTYQMMLTGQASRSSITRAINSGRLFRFLEKPWVIEDLGLSVQAALDAYQKDRKVEAQAAELEAAFRSTLAFVPQPYLQVLERRNFVDMKRGDAGRMWASILFADIRGFTSLIEAMEPAASFEFMNRYFLATEAAIRDHGGFIDHYQGDGTMALFPRSADDAIAAAVAFSRAVDEFNLSQAQRGFEPLDIGMGLHCGELVAGVCGGVNRLQCSVIGDPVNVAARVEGLSSRYRTRLVITGCLLDSLRGAHGLAVRRLETVRAKGKQKPVTVYEVLDALPESRREKRLATLAAFKRGNADLQRDDIPSALGAFAAVVSADPEDVAARCMLDAASRRLCASSEGSVRVLQEKRW